MDSCAALERVNYVPGQLLTASDLKAEQEYFLARFRRHNRQLHGWGVVRGLTVTTANSSEIVIEPGMAIDCAGNEIHVFARLRHKIPRNLRMHFVVLEYAETAISPVPNVLEALGVSEQLSFARIREGFRVDVVDLDPASGHRGKGPGTPGCGCLHPICIARIKKGIHGWKVEQRGRRRV
jgi:hypothetical protein